MWPIVLLLLLLSACQTDLVGNSSSVLTTDSCVDEDLDGFYADCGELDCDDADANIYPGAIELCDGYDNQCPGDDGFGSLDESVPVDLTFVVDSVTYRLIDGILYEEDAQGGLVYFADWYDPDFCVNNYVADGSEFKLINPNGGSPLDLLRDYKDGFESYSVFEDLFNPDFSAWHGSNIAGTGSEVSISTEMKKFGAKSLETYAVSDGSISKASINRELFYFKRGDDVYFNGWYFIEDGVDIDGLTFFDLESEWIENSPGIRTLVQGDTLQLQLGKWFNGVMFTQSGDVPLPRDKWFNLKVYIYLSDSDDGIVKVWQDNLKIIDTAGQTLPIPNALYTRLEVGTSAFSNVGDITVFVDKIRLSDDSSTIADEVGNSPIIFKRLPSAQDALE